MVVTGFRTRHPQISHFGILIILNRRYLRNSRCRKGSLISTFLPRGQSKNFPWERCSSCSRKTTFLSLETRTQHKVTIKTTLLNSPYLPLVSLKYFLVIFPQYTAPIPSLFVSSVLHKKYFLIKIYNLLLLTASLGIHFPYEDHHVHIKILNKICMCFSCLIVLCQFNSQSQPHNLQEWKKDFLPQIIQWLFFRVVIICP